MSVENSSMPSFSMFDVDRPIIHSGIKPYQDRSISSWRFSESPNKSPAITGRERLTSRTPREPNTDRKTMISMRTVSQSKTSRSYVRPKRLEIEYELPEIEIPDFRISYDLVSIVKKVNEYGMWNTESSAWTLAMLQEYRTVLLPKGIQVMNIQKISDEVRLRLINLRNCVAIEMTPGSQRFKNKNS